MVALLTILMFFADQWTFCCYLESDYQMFPLAISVNFVIFFRTFGIFKQAIKCFQLEEFPSQGPQCCQSVVSLKFFLCRIHHPLEEAQHTPLERMAWTRHAS